MSEPNSAPSEPARNRVSEEPEFDGALGPILDDMFAVVGAEGLVVLDWTTPLDEPRTLYSFGLGGLDTGAEGRALLLANQAGPAHTVGLDRRPVLVCPWHIPPARFGGLILWRKPGARPWREADHPLAAALCVLLRALVVSDVGQIGIDRLTGLPNRRWFIDEVDRHLDRLELDGCVGTLSVIEIGNLGHINTTLGRLVGNDILIRLAAQLRTMVRPGDLVARSDGDRFAVWQPAMDHLTAAERAAALCGMQLFPDLPAISPVTLSVGIVSRHPLGGEDARGLLRRAQLAVEAVKQQGAGGWRVARDSPAAR